LCNAFTNASKNGVGGDTFSTVSTFLNICPQGFKFDSTEFFSVFKNTQRIAYDFTGTGITPLLNLRFDEGLEMIPDDVA